LKVFAVNVLEPTEVIRKKILQLAEGCILDFNLKCSIDENNLKIIEGYSEEGYKNISPGKLKVLTDFSKSAGILLDPAYTGKAFCAYNDLVLQSGKGNKIIFLHTGGIYSAFSMRDQYLQYI